MCWRRGEELRLYLMSTLRTGPPKQQPTIVANHHHSGHRNCHHFLTYSGSQFHSLDSTNCWTSHCTLLRSGLSEQVRAGDALLSLGKGWEGKGSLRVIVMVAVDAGWHIKHGWCHRPVPVLRVSRIYFIGNVCFKIVSLLILIFGLSPTFKSNGCMRLSALTGRLRFPVFGHGSSFGQQQSVVHDSHS